VNLKKMKKKRTNSKKVAVADGQQCHREGEAVAAAGVAEDLIEAVVVVAAALLPPQVVINYLFNNKYLVFEKRY
jgi:hypothetical protein